MAIKPVLRMGEPILLEVAKPVDQFDTPELHALIQDMQDTMASFEWRRLGRAADRRELASGDFRV